MDFDVVVALPIPSHRTPIPFRILADFELTDGKAFPRTFKEVFRGKWPRAIDFLHANLTFTAQYENHAFKVLKKIRRLASKRTPTTN